VYEDIRLIACDKMTESYPVKTNETMSTCNTSDNTASVQLELLPCIKQEPMNEHCATVDRCFEVDVSLAYLLRAYWA